MEEEKLSNEVVRDRILEQYAIVFSEQERSFDDLVHLVAATMNVPVAYFALMTSTTHWIKAGYGVGQLSTPRREAMCNTAVEQRKPVIVKDASRDPRFRDHPFVTGISHLRGFISHPIFGYGGMVIGTVCVYDIESRSWSEEEIDFMRRFAGQFEIRLENRRKFHTLRTAADDDIELRARIAGLTAEQQIVNRRMIHSVRNFIATVNANASVLETAVDPIERREIVGDVREACEKMMKVVAEIEELSAANRELVERLEEETDADFVDRDGKWRTAADSGPGVG